MIAEEQKSRSLAVFRMALKFDSKMRDIFNYSFRRNTFGITTTFLGQRCALVVLISVAVGVGWSLLIVGVAYLLFAGISVVIVRGELKSTPVTPERTLHVLQEDKIWLQQEAKSV